MPVVTLGGIQFHTQVRGDGPPVVCAHGLFFGNLAGWMFGAGGALAERFRVHMFDLRGHGRSTRPSEGYDLDSMAGDLQALLEHWGIADAPDLTLAGHSFGALMSLRVALQRPVSRLVLVDPPMPPTPAFDVEAFLDKDRDAMIAALPGPLREDVARGGRRARRFVDGLLSLLTETTLPDDIAGDYEWPDALDSLDTPTLVVGGSESPCLAGARRLAERLPKGSFVELQGGHFLTAERPAELAAAMGAFLG